MRIGLTGGIGSGKSEVAKLLAAHGATVIDADALARQVVARGEPGFAEVVAEFGEDVVGPDGELDRPALGQIVFADKDKLAKLNAIVHPRVAEKTAELLAATDSAVQVYDVPLLVENRILQGWDCVLVVQAPLEQRRARLKENRGMSEDDISARLAAQASDADRAVVATTVIANGGTIADLADAVEEFWQTQVEPKVSDQSESS